MIVLVFIWYPEQLYRFPLLWTPTHWKMFFLYFSGRPFQCTSSVIISKEKSYDPLYVKSFHNRSMLLLLSRFSRIQLCDLIDGSPPGSAIPGILQARILEWVAISFSNAWMWKVKVKSLCRVQLFATPWTAAYQAPPSMGFSRQEYWSGLPLPSPCRAMSALHLKSWNV